MFKKIILCGAVTAFLVCTAPILYAQAQGFMLDPNNRSGQASRDAKPAYKGGVVVSPGNSKDSYGSQTRYRQQDRQPTGPISYGTQKQRAGQSGSSGLYYGNNAGLSPEENAQQERMARIKAYQAKNKAKSAARIEEYNAKRMAERQAMLAAREEHDKRNGGSRK